jgi:integrase
MPTKNRVKLTEAMILRAMGNPPPPTNPFLRDSVVPGLAVRVHPTGDATYTLLLPGGRREKLYAVRVAHATGGLKTDLRRARADASKRLDEARRGREREPKIKPANAKFDSSTRIEQVFREFTKDHLEKRYGDGRFVLSVSHRSESESRFRRFVLPAWRGRDVRSITRKDVRELVQGIERQGKPYPANKTLLLLSTMFNWCLANELREDNPAQRVRKPGVERERNHVLSDPELALVWHGASALRAPWGQWFKFLILSGQRRAECATLRWDDIDDNGLWSIPAERYKTGRAHTVPLSAEALNVLASCPRGSQWPFTTNGAGPIRNHSEPKRLLDAWLRERVEHVRPWRIHDLRRTMRTGLSTLDVLPFIGELVIGHAQSGVHAVYDLHRYDKQKREALDRWAQHVAAIAERYKPAFTPAEARAEELRRNVLAHFKPRFKSLEDAEAALVVNH